MSTDRPYVTNPEAIGDPKAVESFVTSVLNNLLGVQVVAQGKGYRVVTGNLPPALKARVLAVQSTIAVAFFAFILWMMKVPPLAFALGAYLPMEINTPVLIGGLVSYFVSHSSKDEALNELRLSEGSTIASGLVPECRKALTTLMRLRARALRCAVPDSMTSIR